MAARSQTFLWTYLRGDPWSAQDVLGERHQGCCHLHRARQDEDCNYILWMWCMLSSNRDKPSMDLENNYYDHQQFGPFQGHHSNQLRFKLIHTFSNKHKTIGINILIYYRARCW